MKLLHPVFIVVLLSLIGFSSTEINNKRNGGVWFVIVGMIILIGLRSWVGADYGAYEDMYEFFGKNTPYSKIFNKAMLGDEYLEVEWLYVGVGKWVYEFGFPFFIFTLFLAIPSIGLKYFSLEKNIMYPSLGMLLYMFPSYFTGDGGHMRQAMAMAIVLVSFIFIKKRKLLIFLFMIYLAMGFHKSAFIFIFAYWLVNIPFNASRMLMLIVLCAALSPFNLYLNISLLENIAPAEVYEGFQAYETIEGLNTGTVKFTDLICVMYTYFMVTYDKQACANIPYYEYMRNILVIGICMYFIFRGSDVFSARLSAYYMMFSAMVLPSVIAGVESVKLKKSLYAFLIVYIVFYSFIYANMQSKAGYNIGDYRNYLW